MQYTLLQIAKMVWRWWWNTMKMPKTSFRLKLPVKLSEAFVVYVDLSTNVARNYSPNKNDIIYLSQAFTENMMSTYHQLRAKGLLFMMCRSFFSISYHFVYQQRPLSMQNRIRSEYRIHFSLDEENLKLIFLCLDDKFFLQNTNYNASESSSNRKFTYKSNDWNLRITNNMNVRIFAVSLTSSDWGSI